MACSVLYLRRECSIVSGKWGRPPCFRQGAAGTCGLQMHVRTESPGLTLLRAEDQRCLCCAPLRGSKDTTTGGCFHSSARPGPSMQGHCRQMSLPVLVRPGGNAQRSGPGRVHLEPIDGSEKPVGNGGSFAYSCRSATREGCACFR